MARDLWSALHAARSKVSSYVDALWLAKSKADDSTQSFYQDRLAAAARLLAFLGQGMRLAEAQALVRSEDKLFGRNVLETEPGRNARAIFNHIARALSAVEDCRLPNGHFTQGIETLIGERLSSVTFILDYIQLAFDGPNLQVFCPMVIRGGGQDLSQDDAAFRNAICALISKNVTGIEVARGSIAIAFGSTEVDLCFDQSSPEPLVFSDGDGGTHYYP